MSSTQPAARALIRARSLVTDVRHAGAAAIAAVALLVALLQYGQTFSTFEHDSDRLAALPRAQRELEAAYSIDIDRDYLTQARRLLPRHTTFVVVTGPYVHVSMPATLLGVNDYSAFYLFPRRRVQLPDAHWILCYGCSLHALGVHTRVAWAKGSISIAKVVR